MTFRTSTGRNRVVSINGPRPDLTLSTVNSAAGALMTANPFNAETGALVELLNAQRVSVARSVIIGPPAA
jgi:hypothetical protein